MSRRLPNFPRSINQILSIFNRQAEFVRYVISGGTATVVNLAAIWLSRQITNYEISVFIGAIAGTITTYLLTKIFVFNANSKAFDHSEIMRFLSVHAVVCMQIWLVSVSIERWVLPVYWTSNLREALASMIGVGSVVFTGFFLHRNVTFRTDLKL
ncbi:GtrA family protein [Candidatus Nitrotoga arctica]|uniref:GtrA family protein n=1 Tax=Candidatus Nitrotoga arctica TaxID=453162 RepID=UPI001EFBF1A9|nr:GtrA family protein [Candidatus Nitrotoga arctica]